jgi:hypothetical protein
VPVQCFMPHRSCWGTHHLACWRLQHILISISISMIFVTGSWGTTAGCRQCRRDKAPVWMSTAAAVCWQSLRVCCAVCATHLAGTV